MSIRVMRLHHRHRPNRLKVQVNRLSIRVFWDYLLQSVVKPLSGHSERRLVAAGRT